MCFFVHLKLSVNAGHSTWPAVVLDESASSNLEGLNKISGEKSFLVQFFCTHDFARLALLPVWLESVSDLVNCHWVV